MSLSLLFAISLFAGAALLFWVQPLVAKMLLPYLGGSPAVWNICMVFFQTMLLLGYLYVYMVTHSRRWGYRMKLLIHFFLVSAAALFLPVAVSRNILDSIQFQDYPALWLLFSLLGMIGLPFFIVSSGSPLLQHWFSLGNDTSARDPYFLFAASNLGSLAALLAFPFFLEPNFPVDRQGRLWAAGYAFMALLIAACCLLSRRAKGPAATEHAPRSDSQPIPARRRALWTAMAFIPSSLMLGVTQYISTDVAAVPLLWVIPLALYLLTFILVFAKRRWVSHRRLARLFPGAVLILTFVYLSGAREPGWFLVPLNLVVFFIASMTCHGRLADDRPSTNHLVEYYIWIAVGGMGGGVFNALVAPVAFNSLLEYPLAIAGACFLLPAVVFGSSRLDRRLDIVLPLGISLLTVLLALIVHRLQLPDVERMTLVLGAPIFLAYLMRHRPVRFGLAVGGVMLGSLFYGKGDPELYRERNFFGVVKVAENLDMRLRLLYNGNTVHGKQFLDPGRRCEPLAYYHRQGPLGSIFHAFNSLALPPRIAGIGLGTGAMAGYSLEGQAWTFFEINPAVVDVAQNKDYFTYLTGCGKSPVRIILGDARLRLREAPDSFYGLIVLDAFSSDSIPIHLITGEAIDLYLSKLAPGGMVAFHISNRSLDLQPVLAGAAQRLNLTGVLFDDKVQDILGGKDPSVWAVLARDRDDLGPLAADPRWTPIDYRIEPMFWSDDFSNIVSVLKWLR